MESQICPIPIRQSRRSNALAFVLVPLSGCGGVVRAMWGQVQKKWTAFRLWNRTNVSHPGNRRISEQRCCILRRRDIIRSLVISSNTRPPHAPFEPRVPPLPRTSWTSNQRSNPWHVEVGLPEHPNRVTNSPKMDSIESFAYRVAFTDQYLLER